MLDPSDVLCRACDSSETRIAAKFAANGRLYLSLDCERCGAHSHQLQREPKLFKPIEEAAAKLEAKIAATRRKELVRRLEEIAATGRLDPEAAHGDAVGALLDLIDDREVREALLKVPRY